jgi:hypothetical protein
LWAAAVLVASRQTLVVLVAVELEQWLFILHSVRLGPCRWLLALAAHQQQLMIAGQMEAHLASELLLLSAVAAVEIGVTGVAKVLCHLVLKSQVPTVVQVAVLVADFPILWVAMLHLKLCLLAQFRMAIRVVTQSAELTSTVLVAVAQALLVRIEQPRAFCLLQAASV